MFQLRYSSQRWHLWRRWKQPHSPESYIMVVKWSSAKRWKTGQYSGSWEEKKGEKSVLLLLYCSPNYTLFFPQISSSIFPGIITAIVFSDAEESKRTLKTTAVQNTGSYYWHCSPSVREQSFFDTQATDWMLITR